MKLNLNSTSQLNPTGRAYAGCKDFLVGMGRPRNRALSGVIGEWGHEFGSAGQLTSFIGGLYETSWDAANERLTKPGMGGGR